MHYLVCKNYKINTTFHGGSTGSITWLSLDLKVKKIYSTYISYLFCVLKDTSYIFLLCIIIYRLLMYFLGYCSKDSER